MHEYYTDPFRILSDTFIYNQCIITSAFRSIQYLQGTKKT